MSMRKGSSVEEIRHATYEEIKHMRKNIKDVLFDEDGRTIMFSDCVFCFVWLLDVFNLFDWMIGC